MGHDSVMCAAIQTNPSDWEGQRDAEGEKDLKKRQNEKKKLNELIENEDDD